MRLYIIFISVFILMFSISLFAQQGIWGEGYNFIKRNFKISGEIGGYGEYYTTTSEAKFSNFPPLTLL